MSKWRSTTAKAFVKRLYFQPWQVFHAVVKRLVPNVYLVWFASHETHIVLRVFWEEDDAEHFASMVEQPVSFIGKNGKNYYNGDISVEEMPLWVTLHPLEMAKRYTFTECEEIGLKEVSSE